MPRPHAIWNQPALRLDLISVAIFTLAWACWAETEFSCDLQTYKLANICWNLLTVAAKKKIFIHGNRLRPLRHQYLEARGIRPLAEPGSKSFNCFILCSGSSCLLVSHLSHNWWLYGLRNHQPIAEFFWSLEQKKSLPNFFDRDSLVCRMQQNSMLSINQALLDSGMEKDSCL